MLYLLTFAAGAAFRHLLDAYVDYRRKVRYEAWQEVITTVATGRYIPLSEVLRLQGMYDQPEM